MARILAIDYGQKRTGVAVTDPLQMIPQPLAAIPSDQILDFIKGYLSKEPVELIVVGLPQPSTSQHRNHYQRVLQWIRQLRESFPHIPVVTESEDYTSQQAAHILRIAGATRSQRHSKSNIDKVSASLILERYLQRKNADRS